MTFQTPVDIANRALQHLGHPRIASFIDNSDGAQELYFTYDKVRRAELRRNLWVFATRRVALRALDTTSSLLTFEAWASGTTYPGGYIVTYGGLMWVSLVNGNVGQTPGVAPLSGPLPWDVYFGPLVCNAWDDAVQNPDPTSNNTSYHAGEIAYLLTSGDIYVSIVEGNQNEPTVVDTWSNTIMYATGAVVSYNSVNYQSLLNRNFSNEPDTSPTYWTTTVTNPTVSGSWVQLAGASLSSNPIVYPLTAGPANDSWTRNAFRLPAGFLRPAPADPKAGARAWLGAHVGLPADDLTYEGLYITAGFSRTFMMLRFVADVQDVTTFDDMFCEGLAARLALEGAPTLTEGKRERACQVAYRAAMSEARTVDAIEAGPTEQTEDEYVTVRL